MSNARYCLHGREIHSYCAVSPLFQEINEDYEPLASSTDLRILKVRQASHRKSVHEGLDNTAAEGPAALQEMENISEHFLQLGVERTWSQSTIKGSTIKAGQFV